MHEDFIFCDDRVLDELNKLAEYTKYVSDAYSRICELLDTESRWLREDTRKKYRSEFLTNDLSFLNNVLDIIPRNKKSDVSDIVLSLFEKSLDIAEKSEMLAINNEKKGSGSALIAAWKILPGEEDLYLVIRSEGSYINNCFYGGRNPTTYLVKGAIEAYFDEMEDTEVVNQQISLKEFGKKHKELHRAETEKIENNKKK
ncbi:hypothetical protein HYU07_02035 [Candidatus Woesearchaeota archaeon]|nr:hypothetical protein [Candidatus Woesearchaeota archaeon]